MCYFKQAGNVLVVMTYNVFACCSCYCVYNALHCNIHRLVVYKHQTSLEVTGRYSATMMVGLVTLVLCVPSVL